MTEKELQEAKERADTIVEKVRALVAMEDAVLEARESKRQEELTQLESQLKANVAELDSITDELKWATPCFRAYVLPQMSELVGTLKVCDAVERKELAELVRALTDEENSQSPEHLEEAIVTRLRNNIERTFNVDSV